MRVARCRGLTLLHPVEPALNVMQGAEQVLYTL